MSLSLCPGCQPVLEARAVFSDSVSFELLLPFGVLGLLVLVIAIAFVHRPVTRAGLVLGIGLGGFADGIVLHQILQWHSMASSVMPPTELVSAKANMMWDGLFHVMTWLACALGTILLFRAGRRADAVWSGSLLGGSMLAGWGIFNLVERILDHLVLGLHHVHPGNNELAWDLGFVLVGGIGFASIGYLIARPRAQAVAVGST